MTNGSRAMLARQSPVAQADRVLSASSETSVTVEPPVAGTSNTGNLRLRAGRRPWLSAVTLDLALQRGGNVTGYAAASEGVPGATLRWKQSSETSSQWRGWNDPTILTFARAVAIGSATTDYPGVSQVRTLANGSAAFARTKRTSTTHDVELLTKTTRTGAWTATSVIGVGDVVDGDSVPGLCVLPSGRVLVAFITSTGDVRIRYSDDNGTTWASHSTDTGIAAATARAIHLESVEDHVCAIFSMVESGTADDAAIYWSADGGVSFSKAGADATWGPVRTCVTRTGAVLATASNRTADTSNAHLLVPGSGPTTAEAFGIAAEATDGPVVLATAEDGPIWIAGGGTATGAVMTLDAQVSLDHGVTGNGPVSAVGAAERILTLGANSATPRGWRQFGAGFWQGTLIVIGVSNVTTANRDDGLFELNFGGWDDLTEPNPLSRDHEGYAEGCWFPTDLPDNFDWVLTNVGAGATITLDGDGLQIVGTGAVNSYYTGPSFMLTTASSSDRKVRYWFKVEADGSIADDRATVYLALNASGGNIVGWTMRHATGQIRLVGLDGTTLATSTNSIGQFSVWTEVLVATEVNTTATTGTVSAWYRAAGSTFWTQLANAVSTNEVAGASSVVMGGTVAGAVTWRLNGLAIAQDDSALADGFTNPTNLAGRPLTPESDFDVTSGVMLGGASGGGQRADTYTLSPAYTYGRAWVWRSMRPSQQWRTSADSTSANVVFDAGSTNSLAGDVVAVFGTNYRTATWQLNASDSWGSPQQAIPLDATVWQGTVTYASTGYLQTGGRPWVPHQWRSSSGGRRWYVETSIGNYEIADNEADTLYVSGVDLSTASGTIRIYGDRMAARFPTVYRSRFGRLLIGSQETPDNQYRTGVVVFSPGVEVSTPYAPGYVETSLSNAAVLDLDAGYTVAARRGAPRREFRLAWDPTWQGSDDTGARVLAVAEAIQSNAEVGVFWPDAGNLNDVYLTRIYQPPTLENVHGGRGRQLLRVAQVTLREEL